MSTNAKAWMIALITAVIASGIGLGIALIGGGTSTNQAIASPSLSASAVPTPTYVAETAAPTESPVATVATAASPASTEKPASTVAPAVTARETRDPATINCSSEPKFCSDVSGHMTVDSSNKLVSSSTEDHQTNYTGVPKTVMTTKIQKHNSSDQAQNGDTLGMLHISVKITNGTNKTFVFPDQQVVLIVTINGTAGNPLRTHGATFEMSPGGDLTATFDSPVTKQGSYSWQVKTWYYAK